MRRITIEKAELGGDGGSPQAMGNGFGLHTLVSEKPQKGVVSQGMILYHLCLEKVTGYDEENELGGLPESRLDRSGSVET